MIRAYIETYNVWQKLSMVSIREPRYPPKGRPMCDIKNLSNSIT